MNCEVCINDNQGYPDIKAAWEACRESEGGTGKCKYIMQWTNGKYYLRKSSDVYDSNPDLRYVVFQCQGSFKIMIYYLFHVLKAID